MPRWKLRFRPADTMIKVGVTGGIGSGKSTVCRLFTLLGIPVYDADSRARTLMNRQPEVAAKIEAMFGGQAYRNGELDRGLIAAEVFGNPDRLEALNRIVHPAVRDDFRRWAEAQDAPFVIEESAILYESGADRDMDKVIAVTAPEALRIRRTVRRDGCTEAAVRQRIRHQMDEAERTGRADFTIHADDRHLVIPQVLSIYQELTRSTPPAP